MNDRETLNRIARLEAELQRLQQPKSVGRLIIPTGGMDVWESSEVTMAIPAFPTGTYPGMTWTPTGQGDGFSGVEQVSGQDFKFNFVGSYMALVRIKYRVVAGGGGYEPFAANEKLYFQVLTDMNDIYESVIFPATANAADVVATTDRSSGSFYFQYSKFFKNGTAGASYGILPGVNVARINAAGTSQTRLDTRVIFTIGFVKI